MNPKFDLLKNLTPIVRVTSSPFVVLVNAKSPYKTLPELIAAVHAQPGKLSYGTAGVGSPAHMAVAYLEENDKDFKALHVPFKGAVESINAIMGGQIDFTIAVLGAAVPLIKAGKMRPLAVTPPKRVALLPEVPTIAEAANIPYQFESWGGLMARADTPAEIIDRLAEATVTAGKSDAMAKFLPNVGGELDIVAPPAAFREKLRTALETEGQVVRRLGIVAGG